MGKTIVHCSGVYPASSRASSLAMFVLQEAFGVSRSLWRFRMSLGVPDFRNPVSSLEMNHGIRLAVDTTLFSLLASRLMNTMIVTVRRRTAMTDHGIPCVHTQNNSRAVFYAQGQFVLILVCSSRVPPPATLLQHSQNRIVSAHSRVAWECSVSSGRLN